MDSEMKRDEVVTLMLEVPGQSVVTENEGTQINPCLFVCFENEIIEFELKGEQLIGRPSKGQVPDIPVTNKYVSRRHGIFETVNGTVNYTSLNSKNGTLYKQRMLDPNETITLSDGDELIIPISSVENATDIRSAEGDPDIDGLVKLADKALYSSKESGRNRVCIA